MSFVAGANKVVRAGLEAEVLGELRREENRGRSQERSDAPGARSGVDANGEPFERKLAVRCDEQRAEQGHRGPGNQPRRPEIGDAGRGDEAHRGRTKGSGCGAGQQPRSPRPKT
jgi:hypothetical protein